MQIRFLFFLLCIPLLSFQKKNNTNGQCKIVLENSISKKHMNICNEITLKKIITLFGSPIKIEKENNNEGDDSGEESWTDIYYSGLKISLIGNRIEEIEIRNKNWKINNISINTQISNIILNYKRINRKYKDYLLFNIDNFDGVLYIRKDLKNRITLLGISSS